MQVKRIVAYGVGLLFVCGIVALVFGSILGQPVLLSFVETGSMEPTLSPGDGFVAVPTQLTGPVEEGDIVVFRAEELHGGDLTTHRIVGETVDGYVTKGDANQFTDQSGDEPPVKDAQIVAETLQVGGEVVVIPYLGTVVTGIQEMLTSVQRRAAALLGTHSLLGTSGLAYLFFGATLLYYVTDVFRERAGSDSRDTKTRSRTRETGTSTRLLMAAFAALLIVGATAAMVAPAGTQQYGVVSAEFDSDSSDVIATGESKTTTYTVANGGIVPVRVFLEPVSEGIDVQPRKLSAGSHESANATVTLSASSETGYNRRFLVEHRYLAVLPTPVIGALYDLHPWAPIVAIDTLLGGGFYLLGITLVGTGRVRNRSRPRKHSTVARLRWLFS